MNSVMCGFHNPSDICMCKYLHRLQIVKKNTPTIFQGDVRAFL